jgi:hypothetical protein
LGTAHSSISGHSVSLEDSVLVTINARINTQAEEVLMVVSVDA